MSEIPEDLKYTRSHEWVHVGENGEITIGITGHAQQLLGDLVFVELPETGAALSEGDNCAVIESVKAASDVYAPITGEITAANEALDDAPETVNTDPYGDGWIWKMKAATDLPDDFMDAAAYAEFCESEDH